MDRERQKIDFQLNALASQADGKTIQKVLRDFDPEPEFDFDKIKPLTSDEVNAMIKRSMKNG